MNNSKVIVIGLDGSSWEIINLLIQRGELPSFRKIIATGASGTMLSTMPAHSAPAWTTFASGVPPTEHGCLDFLVVRNSINDLEIIDSTKIKSETIYEAIVRHGKTPILVNLPNTFPPKLNHNITITSLMTRGDKYIYPETLKTKYPALQKYRLSPNAALRSKDNFEPYVNDLCQLERDRIAGVKELFSHEPWDFFFYLCSGTDWVSHVVYDKAVREHYEPALEMWRIMDEYIGWMMERLDEQTTLFVMSDHGFKVYDRIFYVNRWLEEQGLLATISGQGTFQQTHTKLSREVEKVQRKKMQLKFSKNWRQALKTSPTLERLAKRVYHGFVKKHLPINVTVDLQLDLTKTKVGFPRGSMASMLYLTDLVPPTKRVALINELQTTLSNLRDADGQPIIGQVYQPRGPYAPALFLEADRYYLSGSLHSAALFENTAKNYHAKEGIFLAYGNAIRHQATMPTDDIINLPPTILHSLGLPVPQHYTGKIMDIFASPSQFGQPPVIEHLAERSTERTKIKELIEEINV